MKRAIWLGFTSVAMAMLIAILGGEGTLLVSELGADDKKWKYFGSSTCGGGSCHAAAKPGTERPSNEYSTWQNEDSHAKAFSTLYEEESTDMAEELDDVDDPSTSPRCLECHSTNVDEGLRGTKYNIEDGVSCDACHGPAEGWFDAHTKQHKYKDMLKLGMTDTRDMAVRATMCANCHVKVKPDLVDAGHPDLSFELFVHTLREPPHWFERQSWDGVRSWLVGQAVTVCESLEQLVERVGVEDGEEAVDMAAGIAVSSLAVLRHGVAVIKDAQLSAAVEQADDVVSDTTKPIDKAEAAAATKAVRTALVAFKAGGAKRAFTKVEVKKIWDLIVNDDEILDEIDDFGAEQVAGALIALYNSYKQGAEPRLTKAALVPEELEALRVRPTNYEPEDLYEENEDEDTIFNWKEFKKRVKAASKLVS